MNKTMRCLSAVLVFAGLGLASGCDANPLKVRNPGAILDDDLNEPGLMDIMVRGVSAELSDGVDEVAFTIARLTDEEVGSGSYFATGLLRRGIITEDESGTEWSAPHETRGFALAVLDRMRQVLGDNFEGNPLTARAYLLAGIANRMLGENFCQVTYDGGAPQPKSAAFERALTNFETALQHAQAAGDQELTNAAYGGIAQANVGLGNWAAAAAAADQVPTDFVYEAFYNANSNENIVFNETYERHEMSAYGTFVATLPADNPRAPYTDCTLDSANCQNDHGADGETPHLRQAKYDDDGANVPVITGTEMLLIRAEAAMRDDRLGDFTARINEVRNFYGLNDVTQPTEVGDFDFPIGQDNDARSILDRERFLTLWLEGRRLYDLHRWDHPFLDGGTLIDTYPGIDSRASCMPIPATEREVNPHI